MQVLVPHGMQVMHYRAVTAGQSQSEHFVTVPPQFAENSCFRSQVLHFPLSPCSWHNPLGNDLGSSAKGANRAPWHLCLCLCTQWSRCLLTAYLLQRKKGLLPLYTTLHHSELSALFFDGFYIKHASFFSFQFFPQSFFLKLFSVFMPTV